MIEKLKQENAELKRLLRVAIYHITALINYSEEDGCYYCEGYCDIHHEGCSARWVYADKAEKLLNGRGEENG